MSKCQIKIRGVGSFAILALPLWFGACSSDAAPSNESDASGPTAGGMQSTTSTTTSTASTSAAATNAGPSNSTTGNSTTGSSAVGGTTLGGTTVGTSQGGPATTTGPSSSSDTGTTTGAGTGGVGGAATGSGGSGGTATTTGGDAGPCPAGATLGPGDTTMMITVDGLERSFLVHAPPAYDGTTRLPVVFDFHGLSGTSSQQKNLSGWDDAGDSHGFIVIYPQGVDNAWNAGLCCGDAADDVAFVRAILTTLETEACVDAKRVYASGCSNGGGMSFKLACRAADVIAGVAPVDFDCVDGQGCGDCELSRPITVVQFRGTNDTLVDYDGSGAFIGAQQNFELWGELNMCGGEPGSLPAQNACEVYSSCGDGTETVLCTVQNGSHCGSYGSFMIPEVAWAILEQHSLP